MSRADEIRAQAKRVQKAAARPVPADPEDVEPVPARPAGVRTAKVRKTVDLSPHHQALLTQWCSETAVQLGQARVTSQDVLAALVARLLTDETFARRLREDLRDSVCK